MRGCTFNLNAGLLGEKRAMGRIGEYGIMERKNLNVLYKKRRRFLHYVEEYRIPEDEIAQVYEGFEVASHAYCHENLNRCSGKELFDCIRKDIEALERLTGQCISGFAYPFGAFSDKAVSVLKSNGIRYARTTMSSKGFSVPENPYRLSPTCWIGQKETFALVKQFIEMEPTEKDQLLYIWGHGYEFEFGTQRNCWDNFKRLCDMIAGSDRIEVCSNRECVP